jgi:heat shock protein HslJ
MKIYLQTLLVLSLLLVSCSRKSQEQIQLTDTNTSKISLDWVGTYKGVLPCDDCDGIETILYLFNDMTYHIKQVYLGKKLSDFEKYGSFSWNKEGNQIELGNIEDEPKKYIIRENSIVQLDKEGNVISGHLADKYILTKVSHYAVNKITDITWRLVEIKGKPVSRLINVKKPIQIKLDSKENRITGFGGCNNFWGSFSIKDVNRISFSKMASTLIACPDIQLETELYRVLDRTDNYSIKDNYLFLNKANLAFLARFEAVFE